MPLGGSLCGQGRSVLCGLTLPVYIRECLTRATDLGPQKRCWEAIQRQVMFPYGLGKLGGSHLSLTSRLQLPPWTLIPFSTGSLPPQSHKSPVQSPTSKNSFYYKQQGWSLWPLCHIRLRRGKAGRKAPQVFAVFTFKGHPVCRRGYLVSTYFVCPGVWSRSLMRQVWVPFKTPEWCFSKGTCEKINFLKNHVPTRPIWEKGHAQIDPSCFGRIEGPQSSIFSLLSTRVKEQRKPWQLSYIRVLIYANNGNKPSNL